MNTIIDSHCSLSDSISLIKIKINFKIHQIIVYSLCDWAVLPIHSLAQKGCTCGNPKCKSIAKHPMTEHGLKDATKDYKLIIELWDNKPYANVGIATGRISNLVVLDIDPRHNGDESLKRLEDEYGSLPDTLRVKTGGGGYHFYFSYPKNVKKISNITNLQGYEGIDVKGDNGYIIAPPSIHASGKEYTWENLSGEYPDDMDLAPLPEWLLQLLLNNKRGPNLKDAKGLILEGKRNDGLFRIACSLREKGLTANKLLSKIREINKERCNPPLEESEVVNIVNSALSYPVKKTPRSSKNKLTKSEASHLLLLPLTSPDTGFTNRIFLHLYRRKQNVKGSREIILSQASSMLINWLKENGGLIQSKTEELFYFYKTEKILYNLETRPWVAFLSSLTGVNPATNDFAHLNADCKSVAIKSAKRKIVKFSYWDDSKKILYVSRFDGVVYKLDGNNIGEETNGENILFNDDPDCSPYNPVFTNTLKALLRLTEKFPNIEKESEMYFLVLRIWMLSIFFTELCPTRPILVLIGEKGSGKSMTLRLFLRLFFGPSGEVRGIPDKPDGFTAMASASHLLVIDNLDDMVPWMRDKLARLSTGAIDEYRRLYTSNEVGRIFYRCWLAFTARTPDTLKRDDIADRLILLPTKRIEDRKRKAERYFLKEVEKIRNQCWGDILSTLNQIVASIREGKLKTSSLARMGDWESLGRLIATVLEKEYIWDKFVSELETSQSDFLLEDDPICDAIECWLGLREQEKNGRIFIGQKENKNYNRKLLARELYDELTTALFGDKQPKGWYKSPQSFAKKLSTIRSDLSIKYGLNWEYGTSKVTKNRLVYWFEETDVL